MSEQARLGDHRVICDFSGFKCWASETVMTYNGFRVLARFAGEETQAHPQDRPRTVRESPGPPNPRPEGTDVYAAGLVSPSDL
jgi:hypothetical protein